MIVKLDQHVGVDFGFHVEDDGVIVIDTCKNIAIEDGLALFPDWVIKAMIEKSKENR